LRRVCEHSPDHLGFPTTYFFILVWFGIRYLPSMGLAEPERSEVVLWGVAECGTLLLLSVSVFIERLKATSVFAPRSRSDRILFYLLGVWLVACVVSGVLGIARGNDWGYLLGDLYRFGSLPVAFTCLYFSVKDGAGIHRLLRGMVAVYGIIMVLDLVRFNDFLVAEQERLTTETAHQAGMIAAAVVYLMLFDPKRWVRRSCIAVLVLMMVLLLRAQMLTPLLTSLLVMVLYLSFSRRFAVFLGCGIAAAFLIVASFYSASLAPAVPSYIADKVSMSQESQGPLESLEALSGVRLGEMISIEEELAGHPANLFFGTGQGSLLSPDPIPDPILPVIRYSLDKHYVHAGLFDALYHNGAIAVGAFLLLVVQIFRRAARVRSAGNLFGLFAMVTIIVTLLLLSYDLPFESAFPLLALCFSGVSLGECAPRFVLENRDARVAHIHPDACGSRSGKDFAIGPPKAGALAS
jgi:hypothetical protein